MALWRTLVAGFRWWMIPALVLLLAALIGAIALTGLSSGPAVRYTAF
jgi:hypothetical protein